MQQYVETQIAKISQEMAKATAWTAAANRDETLSRLAGRMRRLTNLAWNAGRA